MPLHPHARPPGWLEGLLRSGKLEELARDCATQRELEQRLGISHNAYRKAREQVLRNSRPFPPFHELAGKSAPDALPDFADEERTQPGGFDVSDVLDQEPLAAAESAQIPLTASEPGQILPVLPPDHRYSGVSTLLDGTGAVRLQWQKTNVSKEQYREALLKAVAEIAESFRGAHEPVVRVPDADADLLAMYTIGDAHLGLMSWGEETGNDHDLKQGEDDLMAATDHLVDVAPNADLGVVLSLGDFVHFDNESGTTTKGTRQDADTRWYKVMRTSIRAARYCIERALTKHRHVRGIFIRGNHDKHASAAIALALAGYYERDDRVTIDQSPDPFSWVRFGRCLIGANHSEEASKPEVLAGVMACDRAVDWGECLYRYILCGHLHHTWAREVLGVLVERFPTLVPKDAYHHAHGYRAQQSMCVDTYHREWGRVNRSTVGIRQLRGAA